MALNTIEEIIDDIRQGKMVIIMDDEDRENEGDLIMAAEYVRADDINFMARFGRGLICLTLTGERCKQLNLPLMVDQNQSPHSTNFTLSIEASEGVTTGISAADRATTVQAAVAREARPSDLVQPGHIFPLMAKPGGVLNRAGHTEAGCDLARLAGAEPASVIVEILNEDGTMARRPDLEKFAQEHNVKIGTIADLIRYRIENERTIERVAECEFESEFGQFRLVTYLNSIDNELHFALIKGTIDSNKPVTVRVHIQNTLCDVLASARPDCGWPLRKAMETVANSDAGVVVILRIPESKRDLLTRICSYHTENADKATKPEQPRTEIRTLGTGSQILSDLGVRKMRVLSAPKVMHGLSGFDLEVVEYVEMD
jgi:3,4-dihydroxy 2-butanone 4-phosphate synthase/GTP cyclohydrolase II